MITYITGFFIIAWLPMLPPLTWLIASPLLILVVFRYFPSIRFQLVFFIIGAVVALVYGYFQLSHRWDVSDSSMLWKVVGVVDDLPQRDDKHVRFNLRVNHILNEFSIEPKNKPRIIRLNWYFADRSIKPGDTLHLNVKLRPPHSLWNPAGFDYERWAISRDIDAVGYVKQVFDQRNSFSVSVDRMRFNMISLLTERFQSHSVVSSTLQALLIGDKNALQEWQWELLRNTGTTHLMVVSGLHIGVCVALGWWLGRFLLILIFRGKEHKSAYQWLPVFIALLSSGLYVALAGFSIPTQRAWVMAAVLLGAQLLMRQPDVWTRWWLAMAIVLSMQPLAVYEIGFWLSFAAVAALLFLVKVRQARAPVMILLNSQWWIFWILTPLLLLFFAQMSIISPLVNILAIPYLSLLLMLMVPAFILQAIGFEFGLDFIGVLIDGLWSGLTWIDGISDQWVLNLQPPGIFAIFFAGIGAVMILQPMNKPLKIAGLLCWFPVFFPMKDIVPLQQIKAVVFDVGQGTSVLIKTNKHVLLYDTGAAYPNGSTAFERAVMPYLTQQGISYLDKLIISHDDNDHAGGVNQVTTLFDVGVIESGMPDALKVSAQACKTGVKWSWDGVDFRYLHPEPTLSSTDNDRSCVLEVRSSHCSLLITGDAGLKVESYLADKIMPVSWLIAGHHGSRTSTGDTLIEAAKPDSVLISAGFLNRYDHPHADVVSRINKFGSKLIRTDKEGAILLDESVDKECRVQTWRQKEKRYWSAS